jgi:hypothetical protein
MLAAALRASEVHAIGQERYVGTTAAGGALPIVDNGVAAVIFVDSADFSGVARAAADLQADIQRVSGVAATLVRDAAALKQPTILIGTIGKSPLIDLLIRDGKRCVRRFGEMGILRYPNREGPSARFKQRPGRGWQRQTWHDLRHLRHFGTDWRVAVVLVG